MHAYFGVNVRVLSSGFLLRRASHNLTSELCTAAAVIGINGHADTSTATLKYREIRHSVAAKHSLESVEEESRGTCCVLQYVAMCCSVL